MTSAFPLQWPAGHPKTPASDRRRARFKVSFARARDELLAELERMGVPGWFVVISTNVELRRDGLPYAGRRPHGSPGVAVYFRLDGEPQVIAIDCWDRVEDNLRAVGKTVEAIRGIDRWGGAAIQRQAFSGFKALPASGDDWRTVLGFGLNDRPPLELLKAQHRRLAREAHPDRGGDPAQMVRLNQAITAARKELGL